MKNITFTELTTDNAFDFCAVIDAIGLESVTMVIKKEEILALQKNGKDAKSIGIIIAMRICGVIVGKLSRAREEVYRFFANCAVWDNGGKVSVDELRTMKITDFLKMLKDFFNKDDIIRFLEEAAEIFNAGSGEESTATATDNGDMTATVPAAAQ